MTKKPPKKPNLSDDDQSAFIDAMKEIDRLPDHGRFMHESKKPRIRRHTHIENPIPDKAPLNIYVSREKFHLDGSDSMLFERPHTRGRDLKLLKKGNFSYEARLDLHRYTLDEAIEELHQFIDECAKRDIRHALIIHGKGQYSQDGVPVLKNMTNQWLRNHPNVLAFRSAKPKDGGTGAIYVLLKSSF